MNTDITTTIVLDKRSKNKENKHPVKLRVTYDRTPYYFGIPSSFKVKKFLSNDEFKKVNSKNPRGEFKDLKIEYSIIVKKADDIINNLPEFSFKEFKHRFGKKQKELRNIYYWYDERIDSLEKEGKIGTKKWYNDSYNALKRYSKKENHLEIKDISPKFLRDFEKWLRESGCTVSTISMYQRALRAIINIVKKQQIITPEQYPFGRDKYEIPSSRNIKKALTLSEVGQIYNYKAKLYSVLDRSRDYWIFSYLCNGVNIKDIANLKYKNIDDETIIFIRAKTEGRKRQQKPIVAVVTDEVKRIIDKWGVKPISPEQYVFPILKQGLTASQEYYRVKRITKQINKKMEDITEELKIEKKVTTYWARHTYSTVLKRSGASIEFISESLGHSDVRTTENYMDDFEIDVKKQFATKLTDFKKAK